MKRNKAVKLLFVGALMIWAGTFLSLFRLQQQQRLFHNESQLDPLCRGKEHLVQILINAGVSNYTEKCPELPTWKQVTDLYGDRPVILGLETCATYRASIAETTATPEILPRVAGLYNTGTNALAKLLQLNWNEQLGWLNNTSYFRHDVPWGKHVPLDFKWNVTLPRKNITPKNFVMPIVLIRDPFWWASSMCQNSYGAKWKHRPEHCPNLIPDAQDQALFGLDKNASVSVTTVFQFGKGANQVHFELTYDSLVHLWNSYYREYLDDTTHPRLLIRFEDVLFHGPAVLRQLSACLGLPSRPFQYYLPKSKHHGKGQTDFVQAMIRYGSNVGRTDKLTAQDKAFARLHLDKDLMETFQYQYP